LVEGQFWSISNQTLQSLQSIQEQQAVNRVTRDQCSSLFQSTPCHRQGPLRSLTFYRGITIGVVPHPTVTRVRPDHVPAVLPWMWSPLPRVPTVTCGIPVVPLTCRLLVVIPVLVRQHAVEENLKEHCVAALLFRQ